MHEMARQYNQEMSLAVRHAFWEPIQEGMGRPYPPDWEGRVDDCPVSRWLYDHEQLIAAASSRRGRG